MTHAELLRRDAELAMREGGMYYSGEYLSRMAAIAESLEAENTKLRELVRLLLWGVDNDMPRYEELAWTQKVNVLVRELGIEVD